MVSEKAENPIISAIKVSEAERIRVCMEDDKIGYCYFLRSTLNCFLLLSIIDFLVLFIPNILVSRINVVIYPIISSDWLHYYPW